MEPFFLAISVTLPRKDRCTDGLGCERPFHEYLPCRKPAIYKVVEIRRLRTELSFDETKGVHNLQSHLRPRLASWPYESEHVKTANATYVALEEHRIAEKVLLFFPHWAPAHRKLSDGYILGFCDALELPEGNIAGHGVRSKPYGDRGTLAQVDRPHFEGRVSEIGMRFGGVREFDCEPVGRVRIFLQCNRWTRFARCLAEHRSH